MARGDLLCPIDNLAMNLPNITRVPQDTDDAHEAVGEHVHYTLSANVVCANGHRWVVETGDVQFRRIV